MKKLIVLITLLLTACNPSQVKTPTTQTLQQTWMTEPPTMPESLSSLPPAATNTSTNIPKSVLALTPRPSETATARALDKNIPTITPTFPATDLLVTRTPSLPELCPEPIDETAPRPDFLTFDYPSWPGDPSEIVYRIMLLHLVQGWLDEAETVYQTLQEKFPEEQTGHQFAEMATAFWRTYQESQDIAQACSLAIDYANEHPQILTYLGDWHHGDQNRKYEPEDVCPFR